MIIQVPVIQEHPAVEETVAEVPDRLSPEERARIEALIERASREGR